MNTNNILRILRFFFTREYRLGLYCGRPCYRSRVVALDVLCVVNGSTYYLFEERRTYLHKDGRETQEFRKLDSSLGEKMHPGELPIDASKRAVREELGIGFESVGFVNDSDFAFIREAVEIEPSKNYYGFMAHRTKYYLRYYLPESMYRSGGYTEISGNRTTYFSWKKM